MRRAQPSGAAWDCFTLEHFSNFQFVKVSPLRSGTPFVPVRYDTKEGRSRPENQRLGLRAQTTMQLLTNDNQWWPKGRPVAKMKKLRPPQARQRLEFALEAARPPASPSRLRLRVDFGGGSRGIDGFPALRPLFGCFSEPGAEVDDPRRRLPRGSTGQSDQVESARAELPFFSA